MKTLSELGSSSWSWYRTRINPGEITEMDCGMRDGVLRMKLPPPGTSGENGVSIAGRSTACAGRSTGYGSKIILRSTP